MFLSIPHGLSQRSLRVVTLSRSPLRAKETCYTAHRYQALHTHTPALGVQANHHHRDGAWSSKVVGDLEDETTSTATHTTCTKPSISSISLAQAGQQRPSHPYPKPFILQAHFTTRLNNPREEKKKKRRSWADVRFTTRHDPSPPPLLV